MVRALPTSADDLLELYGMGAKKVAAHGALLLGALRPHVGALRAAHEAHRRELPRAEHAAAEVDYGRVCRAW